MKQETRLSRPDPPITPNGSQDTVKTSRPRAPVGQQLKPAVETSCYHSAALYGSAIDFGQTIRLVFILIASFWLIPI